MSVHRPRICATPRVPLVGGHVVRVEHLGEKAERAQRVPQVVHEHRDVVAPLRLEQPPEPERLERGARPRQQLAGVDGLGEVGVGALVQPRLDRVRLAPRRREHDDGGPAAAPRAEASKHLDAVHPRHRHVEQDELGLPLVHQPQRVGPEMRRAHAVAVVREQRLVERERVGESRRR